MPILHVNNVDIAYQLHGEPSHPTLVLIHGLGTPLTGWPQQMVASFVANDLQVLLVDNRDVGKSQQLEQLQTPYQLIDMANDIVALLDALSLAKVHVVGASMGGMIAQLMAINYPLRLHTLTSIMSTTGNKSVPKITSEINQQLMSKPASTSLADIVAFQIKILQVIGSPKYPAQPEYLQQLAIAILERGISASGVQRQMMAIMAAENRESQLSQVLVPSLVIHGDSDGLVNVQGGKFTAKAIPNAKLKIYSGMGHEFPVELQSDIVNEICNHIEGAPTHE
jgi:pimeloyl-ACP methyl ester carboxylesterase